MNEIYNVTKEINRKYREIKLTDSNYNVMLKHEYQSTDRLIQEITEHEDALMFSIDSMEVIDSTTLIITPMLEDIEEHLFKEERV